MRRPGRKAEAASLLSSALLIMGLAMLSVAGTASASVLCKTASNPCTGGTFGSPLELKLKTNTLSTFTTPNPTNSCQEVVIQGEITTAPEKGVTLAGPVTKLSFGGCAGPVTVSEKGSFSVHYTEGNNGTLTLEGFQFTDGVLGCVLTGPTSLALSAGEMGSAVVSSPLIKKSGVFCPEKVTWDAEFTVTAPEPLYVSEL
jgi:hypothetical protein